MRNTANGIVQLTYGDDGLDPLLMEGDAKGRPLHLPRCLAVLRATCPRPTADHALLPNELEEAAAHAMEAAGATLPSCWVCTPEVAGLVHCHAALQIFPDCFQACAAVQNLRITAAHRRPCFHGNSNYEQHRNASFHIWDVVVSVTLIGDAGAGLVDPDPDKVLGVLGSENTISTAFIADLRCFLSTLADGAAAARVRLGLDHDVRGPAVMERAAGVDGLTAVELTRFVDLCKQLYDDKRVDPGPLSSFGTCSPQSYLQAQLLLGQAVTMQTAGVDRCNICSFFHRHEARRTDIRLAVGTACTRCGGFQRDSHPALHRLAVSADDRAPLQAPRLAPSGRRASASQARR